MKPALSVITIIASDTVGPRYDTEHLEGTLVALADQVDPPPMEILVPYAPPLDGIRALASRFPDVRFVPVNDLRTYKGPGSSAREHHDELRARGIALATADIIALLEDHDRPDAGWASAVIAAQSADWAGVGGAVENGIDKPLNWAVYFCDFGRYQLPIRPGETGWASDVNSAYKRRDLSAIEPTWRDGFRETEVNAALRARGRRLALEPRMIVYQHRLGLTIGGALRERFIWGRSYGAARTRHASAARRMLYAAGSALIPLVRLARATGNALRKRRRLGRYITALPLIVLLTIAWSVGELAGYVFGRPAPDAARARRSAQRVQDLPAAD